jgi:hypothetical protein
MQTAVGAKDAEFRGRTVRPVEEAMAGVAVGVGEEGVADFGARAGVEGIRPVGGDDHRFGPVQLRRRLEEVQRPFGAAAVPHAQLNAREALCCGKERERIESRETIEAFADGDWADCAVLLWDRDETRAQQPSARGAIEDAVADVRDHAAETFHAGGRGGERSEERARPAGDAGCRAIIEFEEDGLELVEVDVEDEGRSRSKRREGRAVGWRV